MVKLFISSMVLFSTLGVVVSHLILTRLGFSPDYLYIGLGALVISLMLVHRGTALILMVALMTIGVNLPETTLTGYGIDRDILISGLLLMIVFPLVYRAVNS